MICSPFCLFSDQNAADRGLRRAGQRVCRELFTRSSALKAEVRSTSFVMASADPRAAFPAALQNSARSRFCSPSSWRRNTSLASAVISFTYFSQELRRRESCARCHMRRRVGVIASLAEQNKQRGAECAQDLPEARSIAPEQSTTRNRSSHADGTPRASATPQPHRRTKTKFIARRLWSN